MSTCNYAEQCEHIAEELKTHLNDDESKDLFDVAGRYSTVEWRNWCDERASTLHLFLVLNQRQREILLVRTTKEMRLLHIFAAHQLCRELTILLRAMEPCCQPGLLLQQVLEIAHNTLRKLRGKNDLHFLNFDDATFLMDLRQNLHE